MGNSTESTSGRASTACHLGRSHIYRADFAVDSAKGKPPVSKTDRKSSAAASPRALPTSSTGFKGKPPVPPRGCSKERVPLFCNDQSQKLVQGAAIHQTFAGPAGRAQEPLLHIGEGEVKGLAIALAEMRIIENLHRLHALKTRFLPATRHHTGTRKDLLKTKEEPPHRKDPCRQRGTGTNATNNGRRCQVCVLPGRHRDFGLPGLAAGTTQAAAERTWTCLFLVMARMPKEQEAQSRGVICMPTMKESFHIQVTGWLKQDM